MCLWSAVTCVCGVLSREFVERCYYVCLWSAVTCVCGALLLRVFVERCYYVCLWSAVTCVHGFCVKVYNTLVDLSYKLNCFIDTSFRRISFNISSFFTAIYQFFYGLRFYMVHSIYM